MGQSAGAGGGHGCGLIIILQTHAASRPTCKCPVGLQVYCKRFYELNDSTRLWDDHDWL